MLNQVYHSSDVWKVAKLCMGWFIVLWLILAALGPRTSAPRFRWTPATRQDWLVFYLRALEAMILTSFYVGAAFFRFRHGDMQWFIIGFCLYALMAYSTFAVYLFDSKLGAMAARAYLILPCVIFGFSVILPVMS